MSPTLHALRQRIEEVPEERRLYLLVALGISLLLLVWAIGFAFLFLSGHPSMPWNAFWALCAIAFAGAVAIPLPGTTTALLYALRSDLFALSTAVVGAAVGGTLGAALLLALGRTGRRVLRRRAENNRYKRWALSWSQRFANRWTYAAVFLLLIPFVIPRAVVLFAAALAHLRPRPFLVAVFFGTLLREAAYAALFVYSLRFW